MRTVAVLVRDELSLFEFGITAEIFGIDRSERGVPGFDYRVCAEGGPRTVSTKHTAAVGVQASHGLEGLEGADAVIVSAVLPARCTPGERRALRAAHRAGAIIVSLCSGAFLLADAGLLAGRRCATHWLHTAQLRREHPEVDVVDDALFVDSEDVITAAGTGAAIDTLLHLVHRELGQAIATTIARRMVTSPHREGDQRQYLDTAIPDSAAPTLASILEEVRLDLAAEHSVASLARRAHLSPRTLARRFGEEIGTTPHRWLTAQRVRAAQELLEGSDLSVEVIAARVGVRDADRLRVLFLRAVGTTPARYRRAFAPDGQGAKSSISSAEK